MKPRNFPLKRLLRRYRAAVRDMKAGRLKAQEMALDLQKLRAHFLDYYSEFEGDYPMDIRHRRVGKLIFREIIDRSVEPPFHPKVGCEQTVGKPSTFQEIRFYQAFTRLIIYAPAINSWGGVA